MLTDFVRSEILSGFKTEKNEIRDSERVRSFSFINLVIELIKRSRVRATE